MGHATTFTILLGALDAKREALAERLLFQPHVTRCDRKYGRKSLVVETAHVVPVALCEECFEVHLGADAANLQHLCLGHVQFLAYIQRFGARVGKGVEVEVRVRAPNEINLGRNNISQIFDAQEWKEMQLLLRDESGLRRLPFERFTKLTIMDLSSN